MQELHSGSEFKLAFYSKQLSANILYIQYFIIKLKHTHSIREERIAHLCKQWNFIEETLTPLLFTKDKTHGHLIQDRRKKEKNVTISVYFVMPESSVKC